MTFLYKIVLCNCIQSSFLDCSGISGVQDTCPANSIVVYTKGNVQEPEIPGTIMKLSIRPWKLVILALILMAVIFFAWVTWQFDQSALQSERHNYFYSIDLSYTATIDNVTLLLPVPELNTSPFFMESILNKTAYGISPSWNVTIVNENGTPMLAIRAERMVPEYHGYPIAIEPGASVLPTTRVPGHEYSGDTPVLMPVSIAVMETSASEIGTRNPVGNEPLFFPRGNFTQGSCVTPACDGPVYDHPVPVYIRYTSERPVVISLRVSVQGSNSIWRGGWLSNTYSDTVALEIANGTQGWIEGEGKLFTAGGVYY
jgi:hypothetical protein